MTAINACVIGDSVHLFSDAGFTDPSCTTLKAIGTKVVIVPEHKAVIAANGFAFVEMMLRATLAIERFNDFDTLVAGFSGLIEKARLNGVAYGAPSYWGNTEIVLAGWSAARDAPTAIVFASYDKFAAKQFATFVRPVVQGVGFDPNDVEGSGLELMRRQRAATFPVEDGDGGFIKTKSMRRVVHGFCQHTVVTRDSIRTRVLECWPDDLGQKL